MSDHKFRSAFVPHDLKAPLHGAASGPLAGLTVAIKDMYDIAGERVSGGSPAWLSAQAPAGRNAAVVEQILAAGGTIIGKTVCDEFFYSVTGINHHYGAPLNPRAPARITGGSSAGSASACSAGACDIAIGSDTAGSVRIPAALCGLYGIRTSRGRMDLRGAMAMAPSFDAGGWFAASPGLFALAGPVLLRDWKATGTDVQNAVVLSDAFGNAEGRAADLSLAFLRTISEQLPPTRETVIAGDKIDAWREAMRLTQASEVWRTFGNFIAQGNLNLGPGIAERMKIAAAVDAAQVAQSKIVLDDVTKRLDDLTANGTVLVLPTAPSIAPLTTATPEELEHFRVNTMRLVCMASIAGLPQLTIPVGLVDGAPIGLSFIGWRHGEEALLKLATRLGRFVGCTA